MGITVGVCGTNHPHGRGHLRAFDASPRVDRILIHDADADAARAACEGFAKAEAHEGAWEDLLADPDVRVVCPLLPDSESAPIALDAVRAGKHVYSDKPGAVTAAAMDEIRRTCEESGVHFTPAYAWRADPTALELRALVREGVLGQIWGCGAAWITSQVSLRGPGHWLFKRSMSGGGILAWLGCHWIDLLSLLMDSRVVAVSAMIATRCGEAIDVEDTASIIMRFDNGCIGSLRAGYALKPFHGYDPSDLTITMEGSLGAIGWVPERREGYRLRTSHPRFSGISQRTVHISYDAPKGVMGYAPELMDAFLDAIEHDREPPATAEHALHVLRVLEAAYRSAEERREIEVGS